MDVYLGLGSNLGDRRANLARALELLPTHGVTVTRVSPLVESPAMLPDDAPADWNQPFLNLVARCETSASPDDVLAGLKQIERELGRVDRGRWAPRPIDLDILYFGDRIVDEPDLQIPHPRIAERDFVLRPMAEIATEMRDPATGRTVAEMLELLESGK